MILALGRPYCFCRSNLMNSRSAPQLPMQSLSPLFSITCALFCAMEPSQPLSHQSLPDSLPCNGGRVCSLAHRLATCSSPLTAFFCFQQLTNCPICKSLVLVKLQQWGVWGYPLRSAGAPGEGGVFLSSLFHFLLGGIRPEGGATVDARCGAKQCALQLDHRG